MNDLNQKKQGASVMHSAVTNPGTLIYDKLMRTFIKREFNVDIDSLENEMSKVCWNCGLNSVNLQTCSGCQFAKYCDKKCITDDWKPMHKMMHKIIKMGNNSALSKIINQDEFAAFCVDDKRFDKYLTDFLVKFKKLCLKI